MTASITSRINSRLPLPHPGDRVLHQDHEHPVKKKKKSNVGTICHGAVFWKHIHKLMWRVQWQNVYHLSLGANHPHRPTNSLRTLEYQNTCNRCQSPWLRNKHKVVSTCPASDRWSLGSDLPGVSLLSLFTLNECERKKENGEKNERN